MLVIRNTNVLFFLPPTSVESNFLKDRYDFGLTILSVYITISYQNIANRLYIYCDVAHAR